MPFSLVPKQLCRSIYTLDLDRLQRRGIKVLFADLDNTLARYAERTPSPQVREWKRALEAHGIRLFVLSNSRKATRADEFCRQLDIPYLKHAGKPKKAGFQRALTLNEVTAQEAAIVGDQIFTDILGGNRSEVHSILVHPLAIDNVFRAIRYGVETPFRLLCRDREEWK
jgi:hypothetical protein